MNLEEQVELLTAEEQALKGLLSSLAESEADLSGPIKTLLAHVKDEIDADTRCIQKLSNKLKSGLTKSQAKSGNTLESIISAIVGFLFRSLADSESNLLQLCVKCGLIKIGQTLDDVVALEDEPEQRHDWGGTLVLSVKEAVPYFEQLIEVLREIRDRLPGQPIEYKGEVPAEDFEEQVAVQLGDAKADDEAVPDLQED